MNKYLIVTLAILLSILISGCSGSNGEEFIISGKISSIDKENSYIYVDDHAPIKYEDYENLKVGQTIKFVLYSTSKDDVWDPEKIKVKSVETP